MIFATVGTQLPFPRLMSALEMIARDMQLHIVAQTGDESFSSEIITCYPSLTPAQFDAYFSHADLVIAHAGIGTVLTARKFRKPLILFPRSAHLGEHRNEHQQATAKQLGKASGIYIAYNENELRTLIQKEDLTPVAHALDDSREDLIRRVSQFIELS